MFTGISQEILTIKHIDNSTPNYRFVFSVPTQRYIMGDSILINGVCSTIVEVTPQHIAVEYMPESLERTTIKQWEVGDRVNTEAPLTLQTKLSGALVLGHVDTVGKVETVQPGDNYSIQFSFAKSWLQYVLYKGSITIDGVNLTVTDVQDTQAEVKLIPYTRDHTILGLLRSSDAINLEFDYFTKITIAHLERNSIINWQLNKK